MKKVIIVPYRDRAPQKEIFVNHMKQIFSKEKDYEIVFVHQKDKRNFNRGGMKNIGFIYVKRKYKNWKNITLIFHDIDYLPHKKIFTYETTLGSVKHFYGFKFCFGGIWAIKGEDFEKTKGFPNLWAWGFEDNSIRNRWLKIGGKIDYSEFIFYTDKSVVKLDCSNSGHDSRIINQKNLVYAKKSLSGYDTIYDLEYEIENIDKNIHMINVNKFFTEVPEESQKFLKNVSQKQIYDDKKNRLVKNKKNFWDTVLKKRVKKKETKKSKKKIYYKFMK